MKAERRSAFDAARECVTRGDWAALQNMLDQNLWLKSYSNADDSLLFTAYDIGVLEVKTAITIGVDPNIRYTDGTTLLRFTRHSGMLIWFVFCAAMVRI